MRRSVSSSLSPGATGWSSEAAQEIQILLRNPPVGVDWGPSALVLGRRSPESIGWPDASVSGGTVRPA